jgi:hypothetical protein
VGAPAPVPALVDRNSIYENLVIARSAATKQSSASFFVGTKSEQQNQEVSLDCFAALAMTNC